MSKTILDCSIYSDTDRLKYVEAQLDAMDTIPSASDLERMAIYIMRGKDSNGKNAIERHEVYETDKKFNTFKKLEDQNLSLDAMLENPMCSENEFQEVSRSIYNKPQPVKPHRITDADIPGMRDLWESIDFYEKQILITEGKMPSDPAIQPIDTPYHLYQAKHLAANLRLHQYYLRDAYKPTLQFNSIAQPTRQTINFDSDAFYWLTTDEWRQKLQNCYLPNISHNIEDYETTECNGTTYVKWVVRHQAFDWTNPFHIKALIKFYSAIKQETYDDPLSWGHTLIYDFDRYFTRCHFSPLYEYILTRRIDGASAETIQDELATNLNVQYCANTIRLILYKHIPRAIATLAKKDELMRDTPPEQCHTCNLCGKTYPIHILFYGRNNTHKTGFSYICKQCGQAKYKQYVLEAKRNAELYKEELPNAATN